MDENRIRLVYENDNPEEYTSIRWAYYLLVGGLVGMIGQTIYIIAEQLYRAPWIFQHLIGGLLGGLLVGFVRERRIRKSGMPNHNKASLIITGILGIIIPIVIFYISILLFILFLWAG